MSVKTPTARFAWAKMIRDDEGVSSTAKLFAHTLLTYVGHQGTCYPSNETLRRGMGAKNARSVKRPRHELSQRGYIKYTPPGNGRLGLYKVLVPTAVPTEQVIPVGASHNLGIQPSGGIVQSPLGGTPECQQVAPVGAIEQTKEQKGFKGTKSLKGSEESQPLQSPNGHNGVGAEFPTTSRAFKESQPTATNLPVAQPDEINAWERLTGQPPINKPAAKELPVTTQTVAPKRRLALPWEIERVAKDLGLSPETKTELPFVAHGVHDENDLDEPLMREPKLWA